MSQRREKWFRQMERRVSVLENLAAMPIMIRAESGPAGMAMDAVRMPIKSKRGILQQIAGFFSGR